MTYFMSLYVTQHDLKTQLDSFITLYMYMWFTPSALQITEAQSGEVFQTTDKMFDFYVQVSLMFKNQI